MRGDGSQRRFLCECEVDAAEPLDDMLGRTVVGSDVWESDCGAPDVVESDCGAPDVWESDCGAPDVVESDYGAPDVVESDCGAPDVWESDCGAPDVVESDYGAPDVGESDCGAPDVGESDYGAPDVGESDCGAPDVGESDCGAPDVGESDYGAPDKVNEQRIISEEKSKSTFRFFCNVFEALWFRKPGIMGNIQRSDTEPNRMNHHMWLQGALLLSNGYTVKGRPQQQCSCSCLGFSPLLKDTSAERTASTPSFKSLITSHPAASEKNSS
ncbi:unnamed protein product [Pleuronectes platessa]|uniref:Uncharacterized protein n=1 Tax=Pleuronectes platessa TaxID=8262 RepID=A0A9N7USR9_PLEPL|nr:unnamed protein product [Pleuronectes platessa]